MDPQVVDYYNDYPHGVYVIDKLNEEFVELQIENKKLKEIILLYRYKMEEQQKEREIGDLMRELRELKRIKRKRERKTLGCFKV